MRNFCNSRELTFVINKTKTLSILKNFVEETFSRKRAKKRCESVLLTYSNKLMRHFCNDFSRLRDFLSKAAGFAAHYEKEQELVYKRRIKRDGETVKKNENEKLNTRILFHRTTRRTSLLLRKKVGCLWKKLLRV